MLVTLSGIVMEVRLLQPQKASLSILVTLLGMVTEVSLLQPEKVPELILVTVGDVDGGQAAATRES